AEEEAELHGRGHGHADEERTEDGGERAAGAGDEGSALGESDDERLSVADGGEGVDAGLGAGHAPVGDAAGALEPQDEQAAEDPGDDDRPRAEEHVLDGIVEEEAEQGGGHEGDDQVDEEPATGW